MRLSDLQSKDIVNILDGKNMGRIVDAEVDENGQIGYFVVEKRRFFRRFFSGSDMKMTKKLGEEEEEMRKILIVFGSS